MGSSLKAFGRRMGAHSRTFSQRVDKAIKRTAVIVDQTVVLATPVDTGKARSNWVVSVGSPSRQENAAYAPGSKLGKNETGNANAAMAQGRQVISGRKPGKTIYITNNLDYIEDLNNGTSQQAASGFVQKAVLAGKAYLKKVRVLR